MAFTYKRTITIDRSKCGTVNSSNFPVLISGTYSYLGNGGAGKAQNANGYDIGFYSDSALTVKLDWETELYTAGSGLVAYWVQVPTLNSTEAPNTTDTIIYIAYGDASITTDQSNKTGTWDDGGSNYYKGVWHLPDVTGGAGTVLDSTSNANNGTPTNTPTNATGQIGGAASFNGTNEYIDTGVSGFNLTDTTAFTLQCWYKTSTSAKYFMGTLGQDGGVALSVGNMAANKFEMLIQNSSNNAGRYVYGNTSITGGTWRSLVATYDGSANASGIKLYVNGALESMTTQQNNTPNDSNAAFNIGRIPYGLYAPADIDEVRVSNTNRSPDWILAEYNNQNSPSTFYAIGNEVINNFHRLGLLGVG